MLHKSASAFLLLQSCWQLELIIPWCRRCSFLAGFQKQAGFLLVRAEISLLMDFFFFLPTLQWLQSFEFYDSIDLGWQRPDLKAFSLSISNLTIISYHIISHQDQVDEECLNCFQAVMARAQFIKMESFTVHVLGHLYHTRQQFFFPRAKIKFLCSLRKSHVSSTAGIHAKRSL